MITFYTLIPEGKTNPWIQKCFQSVPSEFEHLTINVKHGDFFSARKLVYTNNGTQKGLVACLDWDDVLVSDAVFPCHSVLKKQNPGCVFTFQEKISGDDSHISVQNAPVSKLDVASVPESIHHLCVINSSYIPMEVFDLIEKIAPICIDWLVRAYVALRFGAIQIPMVGYKWRMHENQSSRVLGDEFTKQIQYARALARSWAPVDIQKLHSNFPIASI